MQHHIALIEKTQSLIAAGDIVAAESALSDLADAQGDHALCVVLQQLAPKDVLAVLREYDHSHASVVSLLITPEQFARAVVLEKQYQDLTHTHLRGMVNAVVFREDGDAVAFLEALGDLDGGSEALANYFTEKWARLEAFARSGTFDAVEEDGELLSEQALLHSLHLPVRMEHDEVADNDWMELAWLLRTRCPDLFAETVLVLRAKARAFDAEDAEDINPAPEADGKVETGDTDRGKATPAARQDDDEESAI